MLSRPLSSDTADRCGKADDPECLAQLLDLAEQTVASCAEWIPNRERERQSYRETLEFFAGETDDGFFRRHVAVVFFSGFRSSIVEAKLPAIYDAFPEINTVSAYGGDQIDAFMGNPSLIRNSVIAHALCPHNSQIECHRVQAMDCGQR